MAYRSSNSNAARATTATVTVPASMATDDITILAITIDNTAGGNPLTITWPSGFTQLASTIITLDGETYGVAWKRQGATPDSGSYSITYSGTGNQFYSVSTLAFSGRDTGNPPTISTASVNNSSNTGTVSISANGVTASAGDDLVWLGATDQAASGTTHSWAAPSSYTLQTSPSGSWESNATATKDNVSSGATGTVTGTDSPSAGEGWAAYLVRIPAGAVSYSGTASLSITSSITTAGSPSGGSGASLSATATITADGQIGGFAGGGAPDRLGRWGRSMPAKAYLVRNAAQPGVFGSDASLVVSTGITADGQVATSSGASLAITAGIVASSQPESQAALTVTATITADGLLATPTTKPIVINQATQQALFYREHGQPYPALVSRSSEGSAPISNNATLTVSATITASGNVATGSGATLTVTDTISAAGTATGAASLTVTAAITAAGAAGTLTSGSTLAITDAIAATGAATDTASVPVTATITAAGIVATSSGAALTITVTTLASSQPAGGASLTVTDAITASGNMAASTGASLAVTDAITATGNMAATGGASLPVTAAISPAASATGTGAVTVTVGITAAGVVIGGTAAFVTITTAITAAGKVSGTSTLAVTVGITGTGLVPGNLNALLALNAAFVAAGIVRTEKTPLVLTADHASNTQLATEARFGQLTAQDEPLTT